MAKRRKLKFAKPVEEDENVHFLSPLKSDDSSVVEESFTPKVPQQGVMIKGIVGHNALARRSAPSLNGRVIGTFEEGEEIQIEKTEEVFGTLYGKLADEVGGWVVIRMGKTDYVILH